MDKKSLFEILKKMCKENKIEVLSCENLMFYCGHILIDFSEVDVNDVKFLDYARLFLKLNTRKSIVRAFDIALNTVCDEYKEQRLLIHKVLEIASLNSDFNQTEILELNFLAKGKCDELLKEENNEYFKYI